MTNSTSTMTEHAPTPWDFSAQRGEPGSCYQAQVWDADGNAVAAIEPTDPQQKATQIARLTAAAPELKAATDPQLLDETIELLENQGYADLAHDLHVKANAEREAIDKATGSE